MAFNIRTGSVLFSRNTNMERDINQTNPMFFFAPKKKQDEMDRTS